MPNSFVNFCYSIAGKREDMEANQPKPNHQPIKDTDDKAKRKRDAREAARKLAMNVRAHNCDVRRAAYREVRRPGLDHTLLFETLDQLLGSLDAKKEVIRGVIEEALRFKRRRLAQMLENYIIELDAKERQARAGAACPRCGARRPRPRPTCACKGRNIG